MIKSPSEYIFHSLPLHVTHRLSLVVRDSGFLSVHKKTIPFGKGLHRCGSPKKDAARYFECIEIRFICQTKMLAHFLRQRKAS